VQLAIGFGVHQGIGDANLAAGGVQAALKNQTNAKVFASLFHTDHALGADLAVGNYLEWMVAGELGELGGEGLSEAVTECFAAGVVGCGSKWQNRQLNRRGSNDRIHSLQGQASPLQPLIRLCLQVDCDGKQGSCDQSRCPEPNLSLLCGMGLALGDIPQKPGWG